MGDVFKNRFGVSSKSFKSTAEVDDFVAEKLGRPLGIARAPKQNLVVPQGNVFGVVDYDIDDLVASAAAKIRKRKK